VSLRQAMEALLANLKHYETRLLAGMAAAGMLVWVVHFFHRKRGQVFTNRTSR